MKRIRRFLYDLGKMTTSELEAVKILTENELRNRSLESELRTKLEAEKDRLKLKMESSDKKRKEELMNTIVNFKG